MSTTREFETEPPSRFDLHGLSDASYQRHRSGRYLAGVLGCLALVGFVFLLVGLVLPARSYPTSAKYLTAGVALLQGYLCFALAWTLVRLWARPPIAMEVNVAGIELWTLSGESFHFAWEDESFGIELLDRRADSRTPADAWYRMWVSEGGAADWGLVWRRLVPIIYIPRPALERVLAVASSLGLRVVRTEGVRVSLPVRSRCWITWMISRR